MGYIVIIIDVGGDLNVIWYIMLPIPVILFAISLFQFIRVRCLKAKQQLEIKHKLALLRSLRFLFSGLVVLLFGLALIALFAGGVGASRGLLYALFGAYALLHLFLFSIRSAFVTNTKNEEQSEDDEAKNKKL